MPFLMGTLFRLFQKHVFEISDSCLCYFNGDVQEVRHRLTFLISAVSGPRPSRRTSSKRRSNSPWTFPYFLYCICEVSLHSKIWNQYFVSFTFFARAIAALPTSGSGAVLESTRGNMLFIGVYVRLPFDTGTNPSVSCGSALRSASSSLGKLNTLSTALK
jgi:hypothetical protein